MRLEELLALAMSQPLVGSLCILHRIVVGGRAVCHRAKRGAMTMGDSLPAAG